MRKFLIGALIAVSSILFVLSIVGIGAAWIANEPLTRQATGRLRALDTELAGTQTALRNTKLELERSLRLVDSAEQALAAMKTELAQARSLVDSMNQALDQKLIPGLTASRDRIDGLRTTLVKLRADLQKLNNIPFVNLNLPGDEVLGGILSGVDSLDSEIAQVQSLAQQASTIAGDASFLMGGDLTETRKHLQELLDVVSSYERQVTDWRARVAALLELLPGWIDRASIAITLILLWSGLSQFGLILHGWTAWHGGDPLAVLRSRKSTSG